MSTISVMHFYSLGIVAANKLLTSTDIEVTPIENTMMVNGEITDNITNVTSTAKDASGANYSTNVDSTVSIKAAWLPLANSNRMTAPDVRRGELVMLFRFADTDKFYWQVWRNDMDLRKLETVIYAFSATTDEAAKTDTDHSYFLEVSTHKKLIHLHTSTANGEPYKYDVQLNAGSGYIQIMDDNGMFIIFDTAAHRISITNQDGSFVEVNNTNINLSCSATLNMNCANLIIKANSAINATAPTNTMNVQTTNNGHVSINGGISVK